MPTIFLAFFILYIKNFSNNFEELYIILSNLIKIVKIRAEKKYFSLLYDDCFFIFFIPLFDIVNIVIF